jgi:alkyl hydroperoxide reductase subunit AhpF
MAILKIIDSKQLAAVLAEIEQPVYIQLRTPDQPEPDLLDALADLQRLCPLLRLEQQTDTILEADEVTIKGAADRGLHFQGPPLGTELAALISACVVVGRRDSGLPSVIREGLASLREPVQLAVFTTPT